MTVYFTIKDGLVFMINVFGWETELGHILVRIFSKSLDTFVFIYSFVVFYCPNLSFSPKKIHHVNMVGTSFLIFSHALIHNPSIQLVSWTVLPLMKYSFVDLQKLREFFFKFWKMVIFSIAILVKNRIKESLYLFENVVFVLRTHSSK